MSPEHAIRTGVGLRHVIEDGITILHGGPVDQKRRLYVLDDLEELLGEVVRGSELVQSRSLFIGHDDRKAFESYSLFDRYLPESDMALRERLKAAVTTLADIKSGNAIPADQSASLANFLKLILASLSRQDSAGLPNEPEQVKILSL